MKTRRLLGLAFFLSIFAVAVQAHPGHDGHELTWDFTGGVLHPLSGWDHLIAMISVGVWAALVGGKARWVLPATFVTVMSAAGFSAMQWGALGATPGFVEQGIAASLLCLGLMMAFRVRLPLAIGAIVIGLFAAFHGWAHGVELPTNANGFSYALGFVAATIFLHAVGLALGSSAQRYPRVTRVAGAAVAAAGLMAALS